MTPERRKDLIDYRFQTMEENFKELKSEMKNGFDKVFLILE